LEIFHSHPSKISSRHSLLLLSHAPSSSLRRAAAATSEPCSTRPSHGALLPQRRELGSLPPRALASLPWSALCSGARHPCSRRPSSSLAPTAASSQQGARPAPMAPFLLGSMVWPSSSLFSLFPMRAQGQKLHGRRALFPQGAAPSMAPFLPADALIPPCAAPLFFYLLPAPRNSSSEQRTSCCPWRAANVELSSTSPHGCELPSLAARLPLPWKPAASSPLPNRCPFFSTSGSKLRTPFLHGRELFLAATVSQGQRAAASPWPWSATRSRALHVRCFAQQLRCLRAARCFVLRSEQHAVMPVGGLLFLRSPVVVVVHPR
jgi:hypothetical protein